MPRNVPWSIALLTIAATLLIPTSKSSAQGAPAIPESAQGSFTAPAHSVTVPTRGLIMEQVEERFGVPDAKLPPVGDPAISRWVYKDFTVYFEDRYVIHGVAHQ